MKTSRKILSFLLVMLLVLSATISALATADDTGFNDVAPDAWYAEAVVYVRENDLMSGTGSGNFSPQGTMTRSMLATVLYRMSGSPTISGTDDFTDTVDGTWYSDAVLWASRRNYINGYGNGLFGTNDPVSREQIATILWRYAGSLSAERGTDYADEGSIASYASTAVDWARANAIMSGKGNNIFDPKVKATRAEVATILRNYLTAKPQNPQENESTDNNTLVAYFSHTGTTQDVAEYICQQVGGDLFRIEPVEAYLSGYGAGDRAKTEVDNNARPAFSGKVNDMGKYQTIYIGYPIWWHNAPMVIATFLESYDLTGKTVIPFCTSASSDISESMDLIRTSARGATVLEGLTANGGREEINRWLNQTSAPAETPAPTPSANPSTPAASSNTAEETQEIKIVPSSYNSAATHQGTVETFSYSTANTTKTAYVYLPYGYDPNGSTRYNILYFMHGGGGNAGQFYNRSYALNDILDHAIENGEIEPLIVVTPTFYPPNDRDSSVSNAASLVSVFHTEFINDLMPAVESHYRTYAESTDRTGMEASRKHRAFGGFSMGSVTTWYQFVNALDYVAYFMPLSGDCWQYGNQGGASHPQETAKYLSDYASAHKYANDFYIYAMTGGSDIAYTAMNNQLNAMKGTAAFTFGTSAANGNISFQVLDGATHDYTYYRNYIYTILPYFFG